MWSAWVCMQGRASCKPEPSGYSPLPSQACQPMCIAQNQNNWLFKIKITGYFNGLTYCWGGDGEKGALLKSTLPMRDVHKLMKGSNMASRMTSAVHGGQQSRTPLSSLSPGCSDAAQHRVLPGWGASAGQGLPLQPPSVWHKQNKLVPGLQTSIIIVGAGEWSPILPSKIC